MLETGAPEEGRLSILLSLWGPQPDLCCQRSGISFDRPVVSFHLSWWNLRCSSGSFVAPGVSAFRRPFGTCSPEDCFNTPTLMQPELRSGFKATLATAHAQVRGSPRSSILARMPQRARTVDVLESGAVDGVDGAVAQLQPLTVEQEPHNIEKVHGEQASVSGREAHRGLPKKGACSNKGSAYHALSSPRGLSLPSCCANGGAFCGWWQSTLIRLLLHVMVFVQLPVPLKLALALLSRGYSGATLSVWWTSWTLIGTCSCAFSVARRRVVDGRVHQPFFLSCHTSWRSCSSPFSPCEA